MLLCLNTWPLACGTAMEGFGTSWIQKLVGKELEYSADYAPTLSNVLSG